MICRVFREAGYIEKLGSGFITLFDEYQKRKLPPPQVIEGENFIKCILPRKEFSSSSSSEDITDQQIIDLFNFSNEISISDVMEATKLSRPTAGRRLAALIQSGQIEKMGRGKSTRYRKV